MVSKNNDWIARARALTPVLDAAAPRIEAACALPADVLDALHDAEMFRMLLPRSVGGAELDLATFYQAIVAIAEGDASTAWCMSQSAGCSMSAAYMQLEAAREVFGDRRAAMAWGFSTGQHCRAVPVEGGWTVNGTWGFGSGNRHATWLGAHCHTPDGTERTLLLPRSSAQIKPDSWSVVGLRGTGSDTYSVTDLFVPAKYSIVPRATGRDMHQAAGATPAPEPDRREQGTLYRISPMNVYQCGFAAVALGVGRATLGAFVALARAKTTAGTNLTLREDSRTQTRIARSEARLAACDAWILQILRSMWEEAAAGSASFESRIRLRLASTHAIQEAREVVEDCYADAGATAIFTTQPFERRLRDIHAVAQQVQASAAHLQSVGQHMLGLQPHLRYI